MVKQLLELLNTRVVIAALFIAGLIYTFWGILLWSFRPDSPNGMIPTSILTVIAAPTPTSTEMHLPLLAQEDYLSKSSIMIGMYVQIIGTDGAGLRLRSEPGINSQIQFIGMDSEAFEVKGGPRKADGFTWWFVVAPYDQNRSGWAASEYLAIISYKP